MPSGEPIEDNEYVDSAKDERTVNNAVRHQYRVLSVDEKKRMEVVKDQGLALLNLIKSFGSKREYSIASTKIEEAVMWAVKGITG